ncbi:S9 family peptidase [Gluconacetobacter diazotrophicus]|uniref:Dipeptidyl peptidase IV n=1 Tax=Gluconacetobacter diazotrophicus (strain ATCC 49037 / DSM 5601 / CCUG 37298 / CIP 103539 / LMG 7603 / PAl5) TaxID=272568 RepID=A9HB48_GLUDA|nr:DPP IV N-terminal domain-containing protein [Gluconacetobacter diazotrophicus]CAP54766.1 dipeptidyl peptidase IV [Gluconacetobacter diazotrophicus PA1 5]
MDHVMTSLLRGGRAGRTLRRLALCLPGLLLATTAQAAPEAASAPGGQCYADLAATRNFTLGLPRHAQPTPDGRSVLFLRSGPRDTMLHLWRFDVADRSETELARPAAGPETLSVEEKARRERARMSLTGITEFALSDDGRVALVSQGDRLMQVAVATGRVSDVPGRGWIAPRLSPDGAHVAAVRDNDVYVVAPGSGDTVRLTHGGTDTLTHGLAEFAAAEELSRPDGLWWSPDGQSLLYEEADTSGVEKHYIADPQHPSIAPVEFRYPRAGTANARIRLGLVARTGGPTRWVTWDNAAFPYLARVVWPKGRGPLSLVVLNRAQTQEKVLRVDPATGLTTTLLDEHDPAWINITPAGEGRGHALPRWLPDGSGFLWAAERDGRWPLQLRPADGTLDHAVTPPDLPFVSLDDVDADAGTVTVTANPDRIRTAIYRLDLHGGTPVKLGTEPGLHATAFAEGGHARFVDSVTGADGSAATVVRDRDGHVLATVPAVAETPTLAPHIEYTRAGARDMDAMIVRPADFTPGRRYPVVLSVYAGPGYKQVLDAPRLYLENQCMANHGFIVVSLDGRGTPGRDHDWERATRNNLIDLPLQDQVDGLTALGRRFSEMDMTRIGVHGWSFGGYFTAMATIRRPDIFKSGVAGAPPADFADYDTAYTERYLGTPQADPDGYRASNVLTYAAALSRPLLIMHGLTDDNVYFENTMKMTQAFITAGRPYNLLLLPGTHMLTDPALRTQVALAREAFLAATLKPETTAAIR